MDTDMINTQLERRGWFDWLEREPWFVAESADDLMVTAIRVLQLNGRFLYLKATTDLAGMSPSEGRILGALARQGDTVFVAVGQDPDHVRFSYRMPDLDNAVAFDLDGLRGLIGQWVAWATTSAT
jgi:hypothetical protein